MLKSKISKGIGIMYKARQFLTKKALLMLYHAYIYPYMTQLNCLLLLQKKIIRIMSFSYYLAHNNNNNNTLFQTIVHMDNKKINKIQC